jgi:hypothetical protein
MIFKKCRANGGDVLVADAVLRNDKGRTALDATLKSL